MIELLIHPTKSQKEYGMVTIEDPGELIPNIVGIPSYPAFKKTQLLKIMEHECNRKHHHQYLNIHHLLLF
jgi:hypothetical protein